MTRATLVALSTGTLITSAAAIGIGTAGEPPAPTMTRLEHAAAVAHVAEARDAAIALCATQRPADRDACEARAAAIAQLRAAELELRYRHSPEAARAAVFARIEARHQGALARCTALRGRDRDDCLIRVHAAYGRALLETQAPYAQRND